MVADETYELALPLLHDETLDDDDKTEKLEELLRDKTTLTGKSLENAVLDCLWRFREAGSTSNSPPPSRHTVIRRPSPAPWQVGRALTPVSPSPRLVSSPSGFGIVPPGLSRAKSSNASPFSSPRPSPRLAHPTPPIPHSPSWSGYPPSERASPAPDLYGDLGTDAVDWLFSEDAEGAHLMAAGESGLNGAAAEWIQPQTVDMSPYDMLRSILHDDRPDEELQSALESNGYDLSATVLALMGDAALEQHPTSAPEPDRTLVVGRALAPAFRPSTPAGQSKSNIICKYYLSTGHCARADCRFSHDTTKTLCKYFMNGNCLAGDTCIFSHDPSALMARMGLSDASSSPQYARSATPPVQDYEIFPALPAGSSPQWNPLSAAAEQTALEQIYGAGRGVTSPPPGLSPYPVFTPGSASHPHSRPNSRHHSRTGTPTFPAVDDNDAFPSLGAVLTRSKRHHGRRGHGHHKENHVPANLADVVRMSPSPTPSQLRKGTRQVRALPASRENSAAAQAIPAPEHIPWLETGEHVNKAYVQARAEAFKHGSLRNKFLQSAAQAWNRSDSRAAKALSIRGQSENNLMREAHREAARILYDSRNKDANSHGRELFVDLHGLHREEAVGYLEGILLAHQGSSRPVYAITGTGHHSKGGKDKVGKAIRGFLNHWRYAFREFSVPGDRNNVGGILGIDPSSFDRSVAQRSQEAAETDAGGSGGEADKDTKIRIVKQDDLADVPKGPRQAVP